MDNFEIEFSNSKHYIAIDGRGRILDGWSDGPHPERQPTEQSILLTEQGGYQFRLFPDGEENPTLWDMMGIPLYKYVDGEVKSRTDLELAADYAALPKPEDKPSPEQRIAELEAGKADRADLDAMWEQMETAYQEGVQQA